MPMSSRSFACSLYFTGFSALAPAAWADDWPQWLGPRRDGTWTETVVFDKFPKPQLDILWRAPISGGYSGPTVAGSRVFVTDRVVSPRQTERVHCFDAQSGKPVWTHAYDCEYRDVGYDAGPRASVLVEDDRAYSLGAMGHLFCFEAGTGKILWKRDLNADYKIRMPVWGIAASPIIDGDLLIVQIGGENGACMVGLDKMTGSERWRALEDNASYAAPIIIEQAGKKVLVVYTGENVVGLDPQSGSVYWKHPFPATKMIIGVSTPVVSGNRLFLTNFFDGSLMLELERDKLGVHMLWKRAGPSEEETDALHSIISTPYFRGDYVYGVDSYGELRCLDAKTGDRVWEDLRAVPKARWATIHFIENGDNVWMFNERGELIIARLSAKGYEETSRAKLIEPTTDQLRQRGGVCWSHPAFANRHVYARNDKELVCASLAKK